MSVIRLLPWRVSAGAWNMAADEALLASAAAGTASLRFYGWSEPTLSLGYFQPHAPARAVPELGRLAWLRRPSGGSALVHHLEVTYCLALPPGRDWQPPGSSWLVRAHEAIRDALLTLGVEVRAATTPLLRGAVLCFLHHTPGDLAVGDCKVVGSAQRKQRGALMQHGSILLRQSPHTPALPGIAELTGRDLTEDEVSAAVVAAVGRRLGWTFRPGEWTPGEEAIIGDLSRSRYSAADWNERR